MSNLATKDSLVVCQNSRGVELRATLVRADALRGRLRNLQFGSAAAHIGSAHGFLHCHRQTNGLLEARDRQQSRSDGSGEHVRGEARQIGFEHGGFCAVERPVHHREQFQRAPCRLAKILPSHAPRARAAPEKIRALDSNHNPDKISAPCPRQKRQTERRKIRIHLLRSAIRLFVQLGLKKLMNIFIRRSFREGCWP